MLNMFTIPELAVLAMDTIGDTKTNRYARDIASEATDWVSNPDWGSSLSLVPLEDEDRVSFVLLDAIESCPRHYERGSFVSGAEDWARCEAKPEDWADVSWMVVYCDERGFGSPDFFTSEKEARADYEARALDPEFADEDEEDEDEPAVCALCKGPHTTPEDEVWSDLCEHFAPLLGEVKRAETFGGTE